MTYFKLKIRVSTLFPLTQLINWAIVDCSIRDIVHRSGILFFRGATTAIARRETVLVERVWMCLIDSSTNQSDQTPVIPPHQFGCVPTCFNFLTPHPPLGGGVIGQRIAHGRTYLSWVTTELLPIIEQNKFVRDKKYIKI